MKDSTRKTALKTAILGAILLVVWAILWALGAIHPPVAHSFTV
jgi:hypothetical protein